MQINIAEAASVLEQARERLAKARSASAAAAKEEREAAEFEKAAYRDFNNAVAAVRPKRASPGEGRRSKKEASDGK